MCVTQRMTHQGPPRVSRWGVVCMPVPLSRNCTQVTGKSRSCVADGHARPDMGQKGSRTWFQVALLSPSQILIGFSCPHLLVSLQGERSSEWEDRLLLCFAAFRLHSLQTSHTHSQAMSQTAGALPQVVGPITHVYVYTLRSIPVLPLFAAVGCLVVSHPRSVDRLR